MRAYTLDEIDRLRYQITSRWREGMDCWDPAEEKEDVERELRTALAAGVEPPADDWWLNGPTGPSTTDSPAPRG